MLFKKLSILFIYFLFLSNVEILCAATYYVSIDGKDSTVNGSKESPWRTIQYGIAQLKEGDTLLIREGIYRESVTLGYANGTYFSPVTGTSGRPITIKNYPGEFPRMSGGTVITNWKQCTSQDDALGNPNWKNIYKATTNIKNPVLIENQRLSFLGCNKNEPIAVYPTTGVMDTLNAVDDAANNGQNLYLKDSVNNVKPDGYWDGVIIKIQQYAINWIRTNKVASYKNNTFTFESPMSDNITSTSNRRDKYSLWNHPLFITAPGKYYYTNPDISGNITIYFWPLDATNLTANIEILGTNSGFFLQDNPSHLTRPTHPCYVIFEGLTLYGYGNGIKLEKGAADWDAHLQFNNMSISSCINGFYGLNTNYIAFQNSAISECINYGIRTSGGNHIKVDSCTFFDCGGDSFSHTIGTGIQFTRNHDIQTLGADLPHSHAITINNLSNSLFAHNKIERSVLPFTTASLGANVLIYGNVIGNPTGVTWSNSGYPGAIADGSVYYVNNTILGLFGAYYTPTRYGVNNIRAGIGYGCTFSPEDEITSIGYSDRSTAISNADMAELFINGSGRDYRRNPSPNSLEKYPLQGSSIESYIKIFSTYFPDYEFDIDIAGNKRSLSTPTIGAYEYTGTITETSTMYSIAIQTQNCSVTKTPNKTSYDSGEEVILTAKPLTEFRFSEWSITAKEQTTTYYTNPITITMDSNITVTAICKPNPTKGQVFHAPLDDGFGTTIADANNLFTGNLIGGPLWGAGWRNEDWLGLNQSTQAITIPTMGMSPQAGTVAVWVEPKDFSGMKFILGHVLNNANRLSLYTVAGSLAVGLGSNATLKTNITPLSLNQPVHLALSWEETAYAVYVNGVQKAAGTFSGLTALNTFIDIGNYGDPAFRSLGFAGKIDDIRTYNRALAAEEIDALYLTHDVRQGKDLQFTVNAVNTQGIPIVYQAAAMPVGASFDAATQSVRWTPWHNQLGLFSFRFTSTGQPEKVVNVEVHPSSMTSWYIGGQGQLTKVR